MTLQEENDLMFYHYNEKRVIRQLKSKLSQAITICPRTIVESADLIRQGTDKFILSEFKKGCFDDRDLEAEEIKFRQHCSENIKNIYGIIDYIQNGFLDWELENREEFMAWVDPVNMRAPQ